MGPNNKVLPWWGWIAAAGFIGSLVATGLLLLTDSSKTIWAVCAATLVLTLLVGHDGNELIQSGYARRNTFFIGNVAAIVLGAAIYLGAVSSATFIVMSLPRPDYLVSIWRDANEFIIFFYLYYFLRAMIMIDTEAGKNSKLVRDLASLCLYYIFAAVLYGAFNGRPSYISKNIYFLIGITIFLLASRSLTKAANQEPRNDNDSVKD